MKLYYVTDLHCPFPPKCADIRSIKQLLGFLNWHLNRKHHHTFALLNALKEALKAMRPDDHLIIGGDITNLGTAREAILAGDYLKSLLPEQLQDKHLTLTPGNHDAYRKGSLQAAYQIWNARGLFDAYDPNTNYPVIKPLLRHGNETVNLIAVNTGVPTPPFFATGHIGHTQLNTLKAILEQTRTQPYILAMHHPLRESWTKPRKRLRDSAALLDVLRIHPPKMILSGHIHKNKSETLTLDGKDITLVSTAAASASHNTPERRATLTIIDLTHTKDKDGTKGTHWQTTITSVPLGT